MPSFLMELAREIEMRLHISSDHALRLADERISAVRAEYMKAGGLNIPENTVLNAKDKLTKQLSEIDRHESPTDQAGRNSRGIVICAGGVRYFRYAWVCINMLRRFGCELPVELWHFGRYELDAAMAELLVPLNVKAVDALEVRKDNPIRQLLGYAIKPFALVHSSFDEVLLLDADNVPIVDVTPLFGWPEFRRVGSVFWPDEDPIAPSNPIWEVLGLQPILRPSIESGQVLVRRAECRRALELCLYLTAHGDFFYEYLRGDRDCFQIAYEFCSQPYFMVPSDMKRIGCETMLQHSIDGTRLFQHRNGPKWDRSTIKVEGFWYEDCCRQYLNELDSKWDGRIESRQTSRCR